MSCICNIESWFTSLNATRNNGTHLFAVRAETFSDERHDLVAECGDLGLPKVDPLVNESSFLSVLSEQSRLGRKGGHWFTSINRSTGYGPYVSLAIACDRGAFEQLEPLVVFESRDLSHGEFAKEFRCFVGHGEFHGWGIDFKAGYSRCGENLCEGKSAF